MKKIINLILSLAMVTVLTSCGTAGVFKNNAGDPEYEADDYRSAAEVKPDDTDKKEDTGNDTGDSEDDFRIGIVTGSFAQSEDDRRGAEAFQRKYGEDRVTLTIFPDNFTEETDVTIQTMVNLADDPKMKAIIVNQAVDGTTEAFRRIKEKRPDILCIAGEAYEDFSDIGPVSDLVVTCDFVSRGYLIIRTAHELGCDTFVHISFPRHMSYETVARRVAVMKAACEEFGMRFETEEAPDPTTEMGVPGAQNYILEHVPEWVEKYGQDSAYFCTNDAHTEPLIKKLMECGGYFIEADLPSPLLGYPGALDLDFTDENGDFEKEFRRVEEAVNKKGGAGRFGTWTSSYGYTTSAGLAEHARNCILGDSVLTDINDITKAFCVFSEGAEWNGSRYTDAETGERADNIFLIYQDTYIMGDPGYYMGSAKVEVPEKYFTIK